MKGEKCGYDRSDDGLFSTSASSSAPAVLPYNSANAKKQSGKAVGMELEHPIPGQALRQMGQGAGYRSEYTVPTDVAVHRNAVGGAGGGISSTGSSATAKGWAALLAAQPTEFEVVRLALIEQINAHAMNSTFTEQVVVQLNDWLVAQCHQAGRINMQELADLRTVLLNRFLNEG